MGLDVRQEAFEQADFERFSDRLQADLAALDVVLQRPGFGVGPRSFGVELELALIDARGMPSFCNGEVLENLDDAHFTSELNRFNLEFNGAPTALSGRPFEIMGRQLETALAAVQDAARPSGAQAVPIGILPTLAPHHLGPSAMTPKTRYRVLDANLRRHRRRPFELRINGEDPLKLTVSDVTYEGANTSFQIHLRVDPAAFERCYNAAQLATAPALAISGNSPYFLQHRLWEESRIAVFKQTVDDRDARAYHRHDLPRVCFGADWLRGGALAAFRESVERHDPLLPVCGDEDAIAVARGGRTPELAELRLHNSTVWNWNRPVYDPADGGHLRIEFRALAAGPTVADMMANAALLIGLTLALADDGLPDPDRFSFETAHHNFYRAAQYGLDAELHWPTPDGRHRAWRASELLLQLLPLARRGLRGAGVAGIDIDDSIDIIEHRLLRRRTGARWQVLRVTDLERRHDRAEALRRMLLDYAAQARAGAPVHTWSLEA